MNHQIEVIEEDIDKSEGQQLQSYEQIEAAQTALAEAERFSRTSRLRSMSRYPLWMNVPGT